MAGTAVHPIEQDNAALVGVRIAHVISTPAGFGGAERTLAQLVGMAAREGLIQRVLNPFAGEPEDPEVASFYAPASYAGRRCTRVSQLPALRLWLARELRAFRPDIIHAHLHHASVLVASLPRRRADRARTVLSHQHGDHFRQIGSRMGERLDRAATGRFDQVVGCSDYVERWLTENYRLSPEKISHVHNGWSGEPESRRPSPEPLIVCVARLRLQKNHGLLLEALALLRRSVPGARLVLVGDGPEAPAIRSHIDRLGLGSAVELTGTQPDVWPLLSHARVFALASAYEPLGIAALEAMAAGLPVVSTAVGGLQELVTGQTGILVPPDDPPAMATALETLLRDEPLAERMGDAGRERAQAFTADRMADGYLRVYGRVLSGTGG